MRKFWMLSATVLLLGALWMGVWTAAVASQPRFWTLESSGRPERPTREGHPILVPKPPLLSVPAGCAITVGLLAAGGVCAYAAARRRP